MIINLLMLDFIGEDCELSESDMECELLELSVSPGLESINTI